MPSASSASIRAAGSVRSSIPGSYMFTCGDIAPCAGTNRVHESPAKNSCDGVRGRPSFCARAPSRIADPSSNRAICGRKCSSFGSR